MMLVSRSQEKLDDVAKSLGEFTILFSPVRNLVWFRFISSFHGLDQVFLRFLLLCCSGFIRLNVQRDIRSLLVKVLFL